MKIEMIRIDDINPYSKNAKKHTPEQITQIANSIREFGFQQPLVIDDSNTLVIGHGRLKACKPPKDAGSALYSRHRAVRGAIKSA